MTIKQRNLRSLKKIKILAKGRNKIQLGVKVSELDNKILQKVGFELPVTENTSLIPSNIGSKTKYNSQGKYKIRRDLPKIDKEISFWCETTDWHGGKHQQEINQIRQVYKKDFILAPSEELYVKMIDNELYIITREIHSSEKKEVKIHICNLMLECFGQFDLIDPKNSKALLQYKKLRWEILPQGNYPWNKTKKIIQNFTKKIKKSKRVLIEDRSKFILNLHPDFMATGKAGFNGYFVYGFKHKSKYILESVYLDNATYVFNKNWQDISKLTKNEIINNNLAAKRIIHNKKWKTEIEKILK